MNNFYKNVLCNIPKNLVLLYYKYENLLIMKFKEKYCYIQFPSKFCLLVFKNKVFFKIGVNYSICELKIYTILIKKIVYLIFIKIYKKLNVIGVGFKVIKLTGFIIQVLVFKLGFSHSIYVQIRNNIFISCIELSKFFIVSNSIDNILNLTFLIKLLRVTNVYNGKGVLFYNEKIKLKTVKSI